MRKIIGIATLMVALTVGLAAFATERDTYYSDRHKRDRHDSRTFALSGELSGQLQVDGSVRVAGQTVAITKNTVLRSTTDGQLYPGHYVVHRPVYVTGVVGPYGDKRASMIIVQDRRATLPGTVSVVPPGTE